MKRQGDVPRGREEAGMVRTARDDLGQSETAVEGAEASTSAEGSAMWFRRTEPSFLPILPIWKLKPSITE
jgi:hypothetical protein